MGAIARSIGEPTTPSRNFRVRNFGEFILGISVPMKRGRKDTLTGGTGDVNPQYFRVSNRTDLAAIIAPGGSATKLVRNIFPLPINRLRDNTGSTNVIEVLKTRWSVSLGGYPVSQAYGVNVNSYLKTSPSPSAQAISDLTTAVDYISEDIWEQPSIPVSDGTSTITVFPYNSSKNDYPIIHDLTDGDGHGILVATDNIYLASELLLYNFTYAAGGNAVFAADSFCQIDCEVMYRFKSVSLQEYIGIVQSQQTPATGTR